MSQEKSPLIASKEKYGEASAPPSNTQTSTQDNSHSTGHKGGLPQLNADDFAPQLVWLALTFGALYWIMSRIALPGIADVIEKRRDHIANDIDAARRLKQKSETAETAYKAALANAKKEAHTIAQATKEELNTITEIKQNEVEQQINAKLAEAEQRITVAKNAAFKEVNMIASTTTIEIVKHLIGKTTSDNDLANALKKAATQ